MNSFSRDSFFKSMSKSISNLTAIKQDFYQFNEGLLAVIGVTAGAAGAVVLAPLALGMVGFGAAGIKAGSTAAVMMSSAAIANGGSVAAGSLVALLQSAGAAGMSATATAGVASVGGATGGLLVGAVDLLKRLRK